MRTCNALMAMLIIEYKEIFQNVDFYYPYKRQLLGMPPEENSSENGNFGLEFSVTNDQTFEDGQPTRRKLKQMSKTMQPTTNTNKEDRGQIEDATLLGFLRSKSMWVRVCIF